MKLIVGLGNPGKEYEKSRHNLGFQFIDYLANKYDSKFVNKFQSLYSEVKLKNVGKVILLKPQTFMNASGNAVQQATKFYKIPAENIFIVFDDLDIKAGEFKIQKGKYPKIHNGVNDIINKLGTDQVWFVRIGSDERSDVERKFIAGKDYVLQKTGCEFREVFEKVEEKLAPITEG